MMKDLILVTIFFFFNFNFKAAGSLGFTKTNKDENLERKKMVTQNIIS